MRCKISYKHTSSAFADHVEILEICLKNVILVVWQMRRQLYIGPTTLHQLETFAHHMASAVMMKAAPAPPGADDTLELEVSDTALCRLLSSITSAHSDPPMTALYVNRNKNN